MKFTTLTSSVAPQVEEQQPERSQPLAIRVSEAARLLDIGRSKCYDLIKTGVLPSIRVGKTVRVPLAALNAWVARQQSEGVEYGPTHTR